MKRKDLQAMRGKTEKEVTLEVAKKETELIDQRLRIRSGDKKNLKGAWNIRRDIAQMKTVLREKELLADK